MHKILEKVERARKHLNKGFEKAISKSLARFLLGHEINGRDYSCLTSQKMITRIPQTIGDEGFKENTGIFTTKKKKEKVEDIKTSLTLQYRKKAWGLDRIVLDTICNHLPEDSGGTTISVEYLQDDGSWVDFRDVDKKAPINAARIRDNGQGFDERLFGVLYSTKTDNNASVGQFGEGIKLVAAACLRENIDIEHYSKDWSAKPYPEREIIEGKEIERLCFKVNKGKTKIKGSVTVFPNPKAKLLHEINNLSEKVLIFNREHEVVYKDKKGLHTRDKIIDLKNDKTGLFVKGILIKDGLCFSFIKNLASFVGYGHHSGSSFNSLFSYDLNIDDISPDRQLADNSAAIRSIKHLLINCDNTEVHKKILLEAHKNPKANFKEFEALDYDEIRERNQSFGGRRIGEIYNMLDSELGLGMLEIDLGQRQKLDRYRSANDIRWKDMFHELFGEKAVLSESYSSLAADSDRDAESMGYNVVRLNSSVKDYLKTVGVKTSRQLTKLDEKFKWVDWKDITPKEAEILDTITEINETLLGKDIPVNIKIYEGKSQVIMGDEGKLLREGKTLESDLGVYFKKDPDNPKTDLIGIRRDQLKTGHDFRRVYIHELGHKVTGCGDYDRHFTDFFVDAIAKLMKK